MFICHERIRELASQLTNESNILVVDDRIEVLKACLDLERRSLEEIGLSQERLDQIRLKAYRQTLKVYRDIFLSSPFKLVISENIRVFAEKASKLETILEPLAPISEEAGDRIARSLGAHI